MLTTGQGFCRAVRARQICTWGHEALRPGEIALGRRGLGGHRALAGAGHRGGPGRHQGRGRARCRGAAGQRELGAVCTLAKLTVGSKAPQKRVEMFLLASARSCSTRGQERRGILPPAQASPDPQRDARRKARRRRSRGFKSVKARPNCVPPGQAGPRQGRGGAPASRVGELICCWRTVAQRTVNEGFQAFRQARGRGEHVPAAQLPCV